MAKVTSADRFAAVRLRKAPIDHPTQQWIETGSPGLFVAPGLADDAHEFAIHREGTCVEAVRAERERIAKGLDDIFAHNLSEREEARAVAIINAADGGRE